MKTSDRWGSTTDKPPCPHCQERPALLRITDNYGKDEQATSSAPCCNNIRCIRLSAGWCLPLDVEVDSDEMTVAFDCDEGCQGPDDCDGSCES